MATQTVHLPQGRTGNTITASQIVDRARVDLQMLTRMIDDPKSVSPASRRRTLIQIQDNLRELTQLRALETDYSDDR